MSLDIIIDHISETVFTGTKCVKSKLSDLNYQSNFKR